MSKKTPSTDSKRVMTPVTWTHPYGSAFFETAALVFGVSQRNADYERAGVPVVKPMSQTPSSNVIMIVLEREQSKGH